jgi:hypothetical protein
MAQRVKTARGNAVVASNRIDEICNEPVELRRNRRHQHGQRKRQEHRCHRSHGRGVIFFITADRTGPATLPLKLGKSLRIDARAVTLHTARRSGRDYLPSCVLSTKESEIA